MTKNEGKQPYKKLLTYRYCYVIFFLNEEFTSRYLGTYKSRRTKEQMDSSARSAKQCIAEGATQQTSLKSYIKMVGVSRGAIEELLEDYKDFVTLNNLEHWDWDEKRFRGFRRYRIFLPSVEGPKPPLPPIPPLPCDVELAANVMIDVLTRTGYLLDKQRASLEKKHETEGGYTENLYRKRVKKRGY